MQDHAAVIEAARQLGDTSRGGDAQLWTEVLEYFGSQDWDCTAQVCCFCCREACSCSWSMPCGVRIDMKLNWQLLLDHVLSMSVRAISTGAGSHAVCNMQHLPSRSQTA